MTKSKNVWSYISTPPYLFATSWFKKSGATQ